MSLGERDDPPLTRLQLMLMAGMEDDCPFWEHPDDAGAPAALLDLVRRGLAEVYVYDDPAYRGTEAAEAEAAILDPVSWTSPLDAPRSPTFGAALTDAGYAKWSADFPRLGES